MGKEKASASQLDSTRKEVKYRSPEKKGEIKLTRLRIQQLKRQKGAVGGKKRKLNAKKNEPNLGKKEKS